MYNIIKSIRHGGDVGYFLPPGPGQLNPDN